MMDYGPVKLWLEAVQRRMNEVYNKSNLYQSLPLLYSSLGTYSTGAMAVLEDDEDVIRTMMFPIGSYYGELCAGSVDTCYRKFTMTVRQLVMEFGMSNVSTSVKGLWESGSYETWIEVIHAVYPNIDRDTGKLDSKTSASNPFTSKLAEITTSYCVSLVSMNFRLWRRAGKLTARTFTAHPAWHDCPWSG